MSVQICAQNLRQLGSNVCGCELSFELVEYSLVADVFPIDGNVSAGVAIRVVRKRAHATAEALGRW